MSGCVNRVTLIGNLARDPEVRTFANGGRCANMTVVTSERWKDKNTGEKKERAEFNRVVVFNESLVGVCERFLRKGSKVYLEGQLETRKWQDQSGEDRYSTEVVLRPYRGEIVMLGDRQDSDGSARNKDGSPYCGHSGGPSQEGGGDLDDTIPF